MHPPTHTHTHTHTHTQDERVELHCYHVDMLDPPVLSEHERAQWVPLHVLPTVSVPPADVPIIEVYCVCQIVRVCYACVSCECVCARADSDGKKEEEEGGDSEGKKEEEEEEGPKDLETRPDPPLPLFFLPGNPGL